MAVGDKLKDYNGLNQKERLFCEEFLKSQDIIKAMQAAGYSVATAKRRGTDFYRRPNVQNYLQIVTKSIERDTIATTAEIREFLTRVIRGQEEVQELVNVFQGGGVQITNRELRPPNNREKLDAAEKMLKVSGAYQKDSQVNVIPIVIKDDI